MTPPAQNGTLLQSDTLLEMAKTLVSTNDLDMLLSEISTAVEKLTKSEAASILLLDPTGQQLVFRVATGAKGSTMKKFYVPVGKGVAGWVAQEKLPVTINDVQKDTRFTGQIDKSSGFSTRSILAIPMSVDGQLIGVCEALNKIQGNYTEEDQKILENLAALAAATIQNAQVAEDNRNFFSHMLEIITLAIEGADSRQTGHSFRVAELACRIGKQLGLEGKEYKDLYYAAILHDIGMIAVHDLRFLPSALAKTIERTPEKLHPIVGSTLVKDVRLLASTAPIILHHHEFVDGTGHPDGLVGEDIPLASRILCLVEHLDELYMKGRAGDEFNEQARKIASEGAGSKFDKSVVDAFLSIS